jgi:hypothetical protein
MVRTSTDYNLVVEELNSLGLTSAIVLTIMVTYLNFTNKHIYFMRSVRKFKY